jgi:hypothetical protein
MVLGQLGVLPAAGVDVRTALPRGHGVDGWTKRAEVVKLRNYVDCRALVNIV